MRALLVSTGRRISPFDEGPALAQYAEDTVGAAVKGALARRGIAVVEVGASDPVPEGAGPTVVLADHCFVSDKCLGDFLDRAWDHERPSRLALARTRSVDYTRPASSVVVEPFDAAGPGARPAKPWRGEADAVERCAYDAFLVPDGLLPKGIAAGALLEDLRASAARVVVEKREIGIPVRLPLLGDASRTSMVLPVTSTLAAHVEHWVHVLWLNHLAFGARWMEVVRAKKAWAASRAVLAGWPSLPRLMSSFVHKGRGVRIHKTAHVEASILGDGVVVGPKACVRNSILADGVEVGDHATVLASTVGRGAYVTPRTFLVWSTIYPEAVINNLKLQVSVVGRGAATSMWAGLIDAKFQGAIEVKKDGALCSTERSFLGSCIGHEAFVGAKVLVHPGREIPNGAFVVMRPDELISDIPTDLPPGVPHVRDGGTLVPLERLLDEGKRARALRGRSDQPPSSPEAAPPPIETVR